MEPLFSSRMRTTPPEKKGSTTTNTSASHLIVKKLQQEFARNGATGQGGASCMITCHGPVPVVEFDEMFEYMRFVFADCDLGIRYKDTEEEDDDDSYSSEGSS